VRPGSFFTQIIAVPEGYELRIGEIEYRDPRFAPVLDDQRHVFLPWRGEYVDRPQLTARDINFHEGWMVRHLTGEDTSALTKAWLLGLAGPPKGQRA
jgi:hypothetical protein